MNALGILAIIIAVVVTFFVFSGEDGLFGSQSGPLATGPTGDANIQNPQPISSGGFFNQTTGSTPTPPPSPKPGESPYKGKVYISTVQRWSTLPREEYISIRYGSGYFGSNSSDVRLDVTGWKIQSARSSGSIPRAFNIPEIDAVEQDIFFSPGGELVVITGMPDYTPNFRENACTAYLRETKSFTPSLSNTCTDESRNRTTLLNRGFTGACIDAIQSVPSCTMARGSFPASVYGADCVDYMVEHLSYVGCIADYRDRKDFLKNTWHVSLKRSARLFDPQHDRVKLYDQNNLLVDEFEY